MLRPRVWNPVAPDEDKMVDWAEDKLLACREGTWFRSDDLEAHLPSGALYRLSALHHTEPGPFRARS